MESDDDNHLCLRCGTTIIGLDNYVSHRRQQCCKRNHKSESPFLSDASAILPSVDSSAKEDLQESSLATSDITKLSADDFFLSLNLQSTANSTNYNQKSLNNASESFCSKLGFPPLESDLENTFSEEKELPDAILHENSSIDITILNDKLENFKCQDHCYPNEDFQDGEFSNTVSNGIVSEKPICNASDFSSITCSSTKDSNVLRETSSRQFSAIPISLKPRTSLRQATNVSSDNACCEMNEIPFNCPFCNCKHAFSTTFLNHLLVCSKKLIHYDQWTKELFQRQLLLVRNMPFICQLCSFYCNDETIFLEHLKNSTHRQNAAKLKVPLVCLPCEIEFSASDDMKNHFFKVHLQCRNALHPIIMSKLKRNLHCCYCLNIVKGCIYLLSDNNFIFDPLSQNCKVIKLSMKIIFECAYGIDKLLLDSYMKLLKCFSVTIKYEAPNNLCLETFEKFESKYKLIQNPKMLAKKSETRTKNSENMLINTYKVNKLRTTNEAKKQTSKKLVCPSCKSCHPNKSSLNNHLKVHCHNVPQLTNNTLYLCDMCGYTSKKFHQLTKHKRSHTGAKPFKCPDCKLSFTLSSQLLRHKRLHTGVKPYKCLYCPYVCNTQENLRKHILKTKKHEGKTMYPCKYCKFECNEFDIFKKHLLNSHSDIFPDEKNVSSSAVAGLYES